MRGKGLCAVAVLTTLVACSGKSRLFTEGLAGTGGTGPSGISEGGSTGGQSPPDASSGSEETPASVQPGQEGPPGVGGLEPVDNEVSGGAGALDAGSGGMACPGCLVSGNCVAVAEANPENPCEICDPAQDAAGWSANNGAVCDDGLFCTVDDVCQAGSCSAAERACEDGVACNGVSVCLEDQDTCSPEENQCGDLQFCDVESDECVSTCTGCVVDGVCLAAGAAAANNPCLVCNPQQSTTSLSVTVGAACGSPATDCSGQDTCNAQGQCDPNHLATGTICGPIGAQCDADDTCNGSGQCTRRVAQNGSPCDDGQFCTDGDRCQGGQCVAGGARNCGAGQGCDEGANQCRCQGCSVGGTCFLSGAVNPTNPCQICNPNQSVTAFVGNAGALCGSGPVVCSGQDTCNAQGQCVPNHSPNGTACGSPASGPCDAADTCNGSGQCVARVAAAGSTCEDGQFCTVDDRCQGGQCTPGGARNCGTNATCDETNNRCLAPPPPVLCSLSGSGSPLANCASGEVCCLASDGSIGCRAGTSCPSSVFTVSCDRSDDCATGSVCCVDPVATRVECRPQAQCAGSSGPLCISSLFLDPFLCSDDGTGCALFTNTPAWQYCEP